MIPDPKHYKPLSKLVPWQGNYNTGDVASIAQSIRRFGFNNALRVWRDDIIAAGNHSFKALLLIREDGALPDEDLQFPPRNIVVHKDEWYVPFVDVSFLDETSFKAFAIADNHLARQATTDDALLAQYLQEIAAESQQTFEATGYDDDELERLLNALMPPTSDDLGSKYGETHDDDFYPIIRVKVQPEVFQRYQGLLSKVAGKDEPEKFAAILEVADASLLSGN